METKHGKHGGNAFFWGLAIGALLATLLTTKRGRQILRELTDLGLELFEDFVEDRTREDNLEKKSDTEGMEEVAKDLESETTEVEERPTENGQPKVGSPLADNGHKKRLFKGIRRK
ncbi:MAG: hypothetical protein HY427_02315 [Candidatus Levybacteria bacterium]|nr:hypothetical protein [Candidatus Levybacteria bacterium]